MDYREKLMQATDLLQRCSEGFGAFVHGRKLARKERDALRRDIAAFLDGAAPQSQNQMRGLLLLARSEIYHEPECVPGEPCRCDKGELMRRIDAALNA